MYFVNGEETQFIYLINIFIVIAIISAIFILFSYSHNLTLQVVICTISGMMSLALAFEILLADFSSNTVVKYLNSPENTYTAEIIDNDQGALGGGTLVEIKYNNQKFSVLLGVFKKFPKIIYDGDWCEFDNMTIKWENENTLLINNVRYNID